MFMFDVMQSYMRVTLLFCFKQKTAYELRISDWSSDVCSSDLVKRSLFLHRFHKQGIAPRALIVGDHREPEVEDPDGFRGIGDIGVPSILRAPLDRELLGIVAGRSEAHTSELQSLMRISYAVFCLKKHFNDLCYSWKLLSDGSSS